MERIANQIKEYCPDCVDFDDKDIKEMVSIVSMLTCWSDNDETNCSTFLMGDRRELIDLPSCEECVRVFHPFYYPFVPDTFKFYLVKYEGTSETRTEITDFGYSELEEAFRVNTGLPSCKCSCNPCGCAPEYKLLVEYTAGYEEIPECYLPVFCNMLDVIHEKNKCECCDDCGCDNEKQPKYPSGDVVTAHIELELGDIVTETVKNMLARMSLCDREPEIWGVIV